MSTYKKMSTDELIVDPSYQRVLDMKRVEHISENFNPALFGTLEVSRRNGKCAVFDGQHRLAALKKIGRKTAPCIVHENLSVQEEAMLFVNLQTQRKALRPLDRFRARLRAGEQQALDIQSLVEAAGYQIKEGGNERSIGAVTALDRVYERGGTELLAETLALLGTYKGEPLSTDGAIIEGLAIAISKYRAHPRFQSIPDALEGITARSLLRKAVASLESGGGSGSRPVAVARQVGMLVGIRGPYRKSTPTKS